MQKRILELVDSLPDNRNKEIIKRRFGLGKYKFHTLEELANIFGVIRERIRQLEARSLRQMRHPLRFKIITRNPKEREKIINEFNELKEGIKVFNMGKFFRTYGRGGKMSKELFKENKECPAITEFWGGEKRGICFQFTKTEKTPKGLRHQYITLNKKHLKSFIRKLEKIISNE